MDETRLDSWASRLGRESMPVFARTIECVAGTAGSEKSSFSELAWSILQDPTLTAQVLKLSNSIYYNPSAKRISTVSRAVMRLGFDAVRTMCLSASLVETVLSSQHRERVALEIARAFHAAVQAKKLAGRSKLVHPEEVFVAALLSRIGQIAFWCFAGEIGDKLERAMENAGQSESQTEMEVLGFRLERLTLRLAQEWKLSSLLESVLESGNTADPKAQCIRLGYKMAQACEKGWNSTESQAVVKKISQFLKVTEQEAAQTVHLGAKDAAEITESFGAKKSSRLIPVPVESVRAAMETTDEETRQYPKVDYQIQIGSLRDLSSMVTSGRGDMSTVLSIGLEGIYRGIGMDRVIFALLTPDRQYIKGKYGLGWADDDFVVKFRIGANGSKNVFNHVLQSHKAMWVNDDPAPEIFGLLTKEMSDLMGSGPFFIMPICIRKQAIGVIYADRNQSGRELDEESFESFSFFGQQANSSLTSLVGA
ncbi:MAG: HDOD domain-containing protein [Syntrophobacteraceae bacterium]